MMEVSISAAADLFLDPEKWSRFSSNFPSNEIALQRLSDPPFLPHGFFRESDFEADPVLAADSARLDKIFELGWSLVYEFRRQLIESEVIATGLPLPAKYGPDRVLIAPDLWVHLWPNFADGRASGVGGAGIGFWEVNLAHSKSSKVTKQRQHKTIVVWMASRASAGEGRRKILEEEARAKFNITAREFSAAYSAVFRRRRGRPRNKN